MLAFRSSSGPLDAAETPVSPGPKTPPRTEQRMITKRTDKSGLSRRDNQHLTSFSITDFRAGRQDYGSGLVWGNVQRHWMLRVVETHFASAGKPNLSDRTPSGLLHLRTSYALRAERQYLGLQIVTHAIEFVPVMVLG